MKSLAPIIPLAVALALVGCVNISRSPDSSESHPANPNAAQSPLPLPSRGLYGWTNTVMAQADTNAPAEHQHGHEEHQNAKPKTEPTKP